MLHLLFEFIQRAKIRMALTFIAKLTFVAISHIAHKFTGVGIDPRMKLYMSGTAFFTYDYIRIVQLLSETASIVNCYRPIYE